MTDESSATNKTASENQTQPTNTNTNINGNSPLQDVPLKANGIDITAAMSILTNRSQMGGESELRHSHNAGNAISDEVKGLGQRIDIYPDKKNKSGCDYCGAVTSAPNNSGGEESKNGRDATNPDERKKLADTKEALEASHRAREVKLREALTTMDASALIRAIFEAQKERTMTYKEFDRGLETILTTGNITNYPAICAKATASFAVLSQTINTVKSVLTEQHQRDDVAKLVMELQRHEKEKLNVTAALHLERLRERNNELGMGADNEGDDGGNDRIGRLLKEGIVSLKRKIGDCIESINEVLEELRYAAADL
mmetsp:Transcript_33621/g.41181  ORF Transcript_33621/g.41181 Transcript_33621/m.41181 type:complete len:313 (-) Transcript_33621:318-1256(-)|eukprot:CAMPEP_0172489078 /NCGR_PEP_ID=MMETSP1066-20121228/18873_1 /TAXON_ID=671091 /ORGANISM="Coscinodiscus wailesii, Strain CCMP2513" /LENGTH=312 /DNA_ID=CAMNT_0013256697 /DNA_START=56 /DNA_END=994 /DNA_ORIENTATION=-